MKLVRRKAYSGLIGGLMFMLVMVTVFSMIAVVVALNIDAAILRFNQQSLVNSKSQEALNLMFPTTTECPPGLFAPTVPRTCFTQYFLSFCNIQQGVPVIIVNLGYKTSRLLYSFVVTGQGTIVDFTQIGPNSLQKYTISFSSTGLFLGCSSPLPSQPVIDPISNNNPPTQTVMDIYVLYFPNLQPSQGPYKYGVITAFGNVYLAG